MPRKLERAGVGRVGKDRNVQGRETMNRSSDFSQRGTRTLLRRPLMWTNSGRYSTAWPLRWAGPRGGGQAGRRLVLRPRAALRAGVHSAVSPAFTHQTSSSPPLPFQAVTATSADFPNVPGVWNHPVESPWRSPEGGGEVVAWQRQGAVLRGGNTLGEKRVPQIPGGAGLRREALHAPSAPGFTVFKTLKLTQTCPRSFLHLPSSNTVSTSCCVDRKVGPPFPPHKPHHVGTEGDGACSLTRDPEVGKTDRQLRRRV